MIRITRRSLLSAAQPALIRPSTIGSGDDGPFLCTANFAADIKGDPDDRPGCWGLAGYHEWKMIFRPHAGRRVRILRAYGDLVAWPRGAGERGKFCGVLFGLLTSAPDGSERAWPAADNCMIYVQVGLSDAPVRAAFDHDVSAGGLLEPDNVLRVRVAVWLNELDLAIHIEPTFSLVYRYEGG